MLRRIWRWLVRFLRQLWRTPPQPSPKRRGSKNEGEILPASEAVGEREVEALSINDADPDEAKAWFNEGIQQILP